jgi:hypothetical protein
MSRENRTRDLNGVEHLQPHELRAAARSLLHQYSSELRQLPEFIASVGNLYLENSDTGRRDYKERRVSFRRGMWLYQVQYLGHDHDQQLQVTRSRSSEDTVPQWEETVRVAARRRDLAAAESARVEYFRLPHVQGEAREHALNSPLAVERALALLADIATAR